MKKVCYISIFLVLLLSGCAILEKSKQETAKVYFSKGVLISLPTPEALDLHLSATQILTAHAMKHTYTSQVALEINPAHIVLVALGSFGGQLFSINYNGSTIQSKALPIQHAGIGIQQTLLDVILSYAPLSVLKNMFYGTDVRLITHARYRSFEWHKKPVIDIHYQHNNHWHGRVTLRNFQKHYRIQIKTVSVIHHGEKNNG